MSQRIYLDHNATTPIDSDVLKVVIEGLKETGNPSSIHFDGQQSRRKLEASRESIARFLQVRPEEILFNSGGTEGAHFFLDGIMEMHPKGHLLTSSVEHACVYRSAEHLLKRGYEVSFLSVGPWGAPLPEQVEEAIRPDTRLICLMAANNETGTVTDSAAIAEIAKKHEIPFVVDGVTLLGKEPFQIPEGISGMFFSGHKIHAPRGIGFCFCRRGLKLNPTFLGGLQEFNKRAGTENIAGIMGLAKAVELFRDGNLEKYTQQMRDFRNTFEKGLFQELQDIVINGEGPRISNTSNLSFLGIEGEVLLMQLDLLAGISASHGSACASGTLEPSRILTNMGLPASRIRSALRFSLSRTTTEEEVNKAVGCIVDLVKKLRRGFI